VTSPDGRPLSRAERTLAEIREATVDMHAAIREARAAKRELLEVRDQLIAEAPTWRVKYEQTLHAEWEKGLNTYNEALKTTIEETSAAIEAKLNRVIAAVTTAFPVGGGMISLEMLAAHRPPELPSPPPRMAARAKRRR